MILRRLSRCTNYFIPFLNKNGCDFKPCASTTCSSIKSLSTTCSMNEKYDASTFVNKSTNKSIPSTMEEFKMWLDIFKYEGGSVPKDIADEKYELLLKQYNDSPNFAKKTLHYLRCIENSKEKSIRKREKNKQIYSELQELKEKYDNDHIKYGLWNNAMFGKWRPKDIKTFDDQKIMTSKLFGQPLIFDCGYDEFMRGREISSCARELSFCVSLNRSSPEPYNMFFCNNDPNSPVLKELHKLIPNLYRDSGPTITNDSYLDIFPKEKLIYLSPNGSEVMKIFDNNAIYIIGGIVDLKQQKPLTLAKAKREGIRTLKLPLDRYRRFVGHKTLGIHVMAAIMLELQNSSDFNKAFDNIPQRLLSESSKNIRFGQSIWDKGFSAAASTSSRKGRIDLVKQKFNIPDEEASN